MRRLGIEKRHLLAMIAIGTGWPLAAKAVAHFIQAAN
ncbi:hypothetical protein SAMN04489858_10180 [Paracoccus homiensis]|uniref:Uncharacterized protein n=1 Tax=Paracoccus homiensis TaxID=364199 RepID=A0A1H9Y930_9RHOB|nr:hypothetical protein SAMN04489858_10180 [Paracoccus homiensis]